MHRKSAASRKEHEYELLNDMKKTIFICLLAVVAMGWTSCQSQDAPKHKKTIDLNVNQSQWDFDNSANMFFCHFDIPELTAQVYDYGEISVNHEYNSGTAKAYQVALPETVYKTEDLDNGDGTTSPYYYQQHIDYAYGVGFVEVFVTISDFYYEGYTPESMVFRMQMTY